MVRGTGIMFYVHYDNDYNITSIANIIDPNGLFLEIDEQLFNDFNTGQKEMFNYKIAEDVTTKGKYYVVPTDFSEQQLEKHQTGLIEKKDTTTDNCIQIVQNSSSWTVNNYMSNETCAALSNGDDHIKEYYIVSSKNRFILFDKFSINLKELSTKNIIVIDSNSANNNASILTLGSSIEHVHKGKYYENN